jgi:hypothetical protein
MNLLNLINPYLANVYYSTTVLNHDAIRLKRFVSQFFFELSNWFFLSIFNTLYAFYACVQCPNILRDTVEILFGSALVRRLTTRFTVNLSPPINYTVAHV